MNKEESWGKRPDTWGEYQRKSSDEEQNKIIDAWIERRNKQIGEILIPQIGEWPPNLENFYGAQVNEYINTDLIRHWAEAFGDRNPLWRSQGYARKTRWGGIIAPPGLVDSISHPYPGWVEPEQYRKFNSCIRLPHFENCRWFQVMRPGDKIGIIQKFTGLKEFESPFPKPSRLIVETERRWFNNQREETVAIVDYSMAYYLNIPAGGSPYPGVNRGRRRLTDEERDTIYRRYNSEKPRGADTLFWEEVEVGNESEPLLCGPVSIYDSICTFQALGGHAVGFAMQWDRIRLNFDYAVLDEEVNAWKCGGECHVCDGAGHSANYGKGVAYAQAPMMYGVRCHALTNWMGDDAFLKKLDNLPLDVAFIGDVLKTKIKVTKKYKEGDEHLVDLDVSTVNMDDIPLVQGAATVRLASRTEI